MIYNLGNYRYRDYSIWKKRWLIFWTCIDPGPYTYMEGVKVVNSLCGIKEEEEEDYSGLTRVDTSNELVGCFLVNFKKDPNHGFFGNCPLVATIVPYRGVLEVMWVNGHTTVSDHSELNVFKLEEVTDGTLVNTTS